MKPIFLFACLFLCAWGFAQTPVAINGQLKVTGTKLTNQNGYPIQLRGMSSHGIQWYGQCITDASLDAVANNWGADVFRIAMYVQEDGYETNPTYFTNQVKTLVNKITARGMYAIIDFHMLTPGDPNYNTNRAITFFTDIANTFKNYNNVLYEICNEPNGGVTWATIKNYANQVIPVIRAIDADAPIIVGTRAWSSLGLSEGSTAQEILNNPLTFQNILYTFHFYAKDHRDSYLNHLDWASDRLPIFVTEFGTQEASGDGANDLTMSQRYIDLMRTKKISWCNWNFSDDFRSGAVWQTGTCGGTNWTTSRLKEAGTWVRNNILTPADDFSGTTPPPPTGGVLIQAESYNTMSGVQTEATTDTDGGQNVGWIDQGDWMAFYNINFPVTGTYKVEYRVASQNGGGRVSCDLNAGSIQLGQIDVPNTGGWQNWTTISHNITVNAGTYNFGVYAQAGGWNLNWIRITPVTTTTKNATRMEADARAANSLEQLIQVYPVPSKDQVTITLPESNQKTQIMVTDLNGKTYYTGIASGNIHQLHISQYPAGIYVVQLINGNTRIIKRIVKK